MVWAVSVASVAVATDTEAPSVADIRLLDESPNWLDVLEHQWSDGVPEDVARAQGNSDRYGLLLGTGGTVVTTLNECIALAVESNTDLQIQRLNPLSATAGVRRARSIFDPKLFADVTRDRLVQPATSPLTAGTATALFNQSFSLNTGLRKTLLSGGQTELKWTNSRVSTNPSIANLLVPKYSTGLNLSLVQPLLRDFGWRYSTLLVQIAETTEEASYHQYEAGIASLVAAVERAYWFLVLAMQSVIVQEQGLALSRELLRQNEGKYNVGALPRTAVLEAQSEVARREATLLRVVNARNVARDNLRAIVNSRSPEAANLIMIDPQDKPSASPVKVSVDESLDTALRLRPELRAARLNVNGRGLQRKVAENQLLPRFNFVGNIGVNSVSGSRPTVAFGSGQENCNVTNNADGTVNIDCPPSTVQAPNRLDGGYGRALEMLPDGRFYNYSAGAVIEIPLSNAQARADYSRANVDLEQSKLGLRKLQEDVSLEVTTAVSNVDTDLRSIDATRLARELAEENVRNQQARYDVGLATTKDLLDFQEKLTQARFLEVEALTRYNTDLAELRRVEGSLLSSRSIIVDRGKPEDTPWWAWF